VPLRSFVTVTRYIEGTETATRLRVRTVLKHGDNETGKRVSDEKCGAYVSSYMRSVPSWNCILYPRMDKEKIAKLFTERS
jgi:hypothetical protein